jgi:hypothetical protein
MPDEDRHYPQRPVTVMISAEGIAERLTQLPTRKEMYRAILLGVTTGACLVQTYSSFIWQKNPVVEYDRASTWPGKWHLLPPS